MVAIEGMDPRTGRFQPGNTLGQGLKSAKKVRALRQTLLAAVTEEDMIAVTRELVRMAKTGSIEHIRELYSRTLGKPIEADMDQRIADLEELLLSL
ncbi:hypothetical protein DRQ53_13680 [bacterium]|nr:MAG: hypothetical protein DRQ53_13680 [bacterium]